MLAPQLLGRLLNEVKTNENVRRLLKQCDEEGPVQNALLPTYHCMHTPGGPLKYVSMHYTLNQSILLTFLSIDQNYFIKINITCNKF